MSEFESLEKELAEIRPRQPSAELKARIAERLQPSTRSIETAPRRVQIRVAVVRGLVAAGLAAIVFWLGRISRIESQPQDPTQQLPMASAFDFDAPSAWSYRAALGQSPDSLEALLDRPSAGGRPFGSGHLNVHAFARIDSDMNDKFGEL
jgi:hypothetical protein